MAWEGPQICMTFTAGSTLASAQFKFVKLSAANTVVPCSNVTDIPIGVVQNNPASGGAASVCLYGVTKVQGDADLAFGSQVGTSADAQAAAYTVSDTTKHLVGIVLEDNAAAAGLATIMFYGSARANIA